MRYRPLRVVLAAALVIVAGAAVTSPVAVNASPAACANAAESAATAELTAKTCGIPVEITGERSQTTEVFANPDGTRTAQESLVTRFAKNAQGKWVDADPTLVTNADGSLSPAAATFPMRFSGGGTGALITAAKDGTSMSLTWPGSLPKPTVNGHVATYAEVLQGVDLQVIATADAFSEHLIVKDRAAAVQGALARLNFGVVTTGLNLFTDANGATIAADSAGHTIFSAGTPRIWDASGNERRSAAMHADFTAGRLSVVPDRGLLTDPAAQFPLVIDPSFSASRNHWLLLRKSNPTTSYWDIANGDISSTDATDGLIRVGFSDWQSPQFTDRSTFQFNTSTAVGTHVTSAVFRLHQLWSGVSDSSSPCTGGGAVGLYRLSSAITSSTNWNTSWNSTGTGWANLLGTNSEVHKNGASPCGPADVEWNLNSYISTLGLGTVSSVNLGIKGQSETNDNTWKRYDISKTTLSITYNSYPNTPDTMTIDSLPCGTGANAAYVSTLNGHNPVLKARVSDPDSGSTMTGKFTWTTSTGNATASQGSVTNGGYAQVTTTGSAFTTNNTYSFTVSASDGTDWSKNSGGPCEFVVDDTAPATKPTVASADGRYLEDPSGANGWRDGVGKTGSFTFSANGTNDVAGYYYGMTNPPATYVAAGSIGGSATGAITPAGPGVNDLYVRSADRVGNLGPVYDYRFWVGSGTAPVALWTLANSGALGQDTGTGTGTPAVPHPLSWTGSAAASGGRIFGTFAGDFFGNNYASAGAPVLDSTKSFTVAAWVKVNDVSGNYTAVSQDGNSNSAFYLQELFGKWSFSAATLDSNSATDKHAQSTIAAIPGVWTHLAGVYDLGTGQIRLYVNGTLAGTDTLGANWSATGSTMVGRAKYHGVLSDFFKGAIADVRVWDRVVDANEISALAAPTLVAAWDLDDGAGTAVADTGPYAHPGTLSATGVTWNMTGHNFNDLGSATFDGSTGGITSAGPVVQTNQSFTVAAWVNPASLPAYLTILCETGAHNSGAVLQYEPGSGWSLAAQANDAVNPPAATRAKSGTAYVQTNAWQHVAGVYDAQAGQMRIYVNGVLRGTASVNIGWNATGHLLVGHELFSDSNISYFPGGIDAVRVYQGALSDAQISALAGQ